MNNPTRHRKGRAILPFLFFLILSNFALSDWVMPQPSIIYGNFNVTGNATMDNLFVDSIWLGGSVWTRQENVLIINTTTYVNTDTINATNGYFSNSVGVGTVSPTDLLHLKKAGDAIQKIEATGNGNSAILEFSRERLAGEDATGGAIYLTGNLTNNDAVLNLIASTAAAGPSSTGPKISIKDVSTGINNDIKFYNDGNTLMTIRGDGNIGIGTTNPSGLLDVVGTSTANIHIRGTNTFLQLNRSANGQGSRIIFQTAGVDIGEIGYIGNVADTLSITDGSLNTFITMNTSSNKFEVTSSNFPVGSFIRTTTGTGGAFETVNGLGSGYSLRTVTNGNMSDGFGGGILLSGQDATSSSSLTSGVFGRIYARRDGSDTTGAMQFFTQGTNADIPTMTLRASGNVGIGTVTPLTILYVNGSGISLDRSGNFGQYIDYYRNGNRTWQLHGGIASGLDNLAIRNQALTTVMVFNQTGIIGIGTTAPSGTANTLLDIRGHLKVAYTSALGYIYFTSASTNPYLSYGTIANSWTFADANSYKMTILASNGNVGIGTTTPTNGKLQIVGKTLLTGSNARLSLQRTDGSNYIEWADNQTLIFRTIKEDDTNSTNHIGITKDGNFGIGTTTPTSKLDIVGNAVNLTTLNIPSGEGQAIVFKGNATYWDDFFVQGLQLTGGIFSPTLTVINDSATYCFAGTVRNEYAYGSVELNHGWKEGSMLLPHIHVQKEDSGTGNITFNLAWNIADNTHRIRSNTNITVTDATTFPVIRGFNEDINASGFTLGATWSFTLTRLQDATTDTYTGNACIWQVSAHYESDTLGSASEIGKWA